VNRALRGGQAPAAFHSQDLYSAARRPAMSKAVERSIGFPRPELSDKFRLEIF
jgi:hypothetical protein